MMELSYEKKEKKLGAMTALMLGATVFLPTKRALGMGDDIGNTAADAEKIRTVTYKKTAAKQVLAGDTFVNSTLCSAASVVLRHLRGAPVTKDNLVKSLQALYVGGIGKVMAHESTFKPDLSNEELGALVTQGLKRVSLTQDDPFDSVMTKQIYTVSAFGLKDRKDALNSIIGDKSAIESLFAKNLHHVIEETPDILNSFLAYLPQTKEEKLNQHICTESFARYFTSLKTVEDWLPTTPTLTYREKQLRDNPSVEYDMQLTKAAEVYGFLLQREKNLLKSKPSPERKTTSVATSLPASTSSGSSEAFKTQLAQALAKKTETEQIAGPSSSSSSRPELETASPPSSSMSLPLAEEATSVRTPGRIAIYRDGAPLSVLSFPGDFKLADTLREKRLGGHPLSVSITPEIDEIKGDGFNYYFTASKEQMASLNGATLLFQVQMKSNAPAYIEYWDGLKEICSASHSGSDRWETLTIEFTVNSDGARWFNFYPAILSAVEGIASPSTQIRNCILHYKK